MRTKVIEPVNELLTKINAANNTANVRTSVQDFFWAKIGPDSDTPLLRDGNKDGTINKADIEVPMTCKVVVSGAPVTRTCLDTDRLTDLQDIQLKVPIGGEASASSKPFDAGFPGLRLASKDSFSAGIGYQIDLAVGLDRTNGFYIPVNAYGSQPEVRVEATASLPNKLDAQIAFIPASLTDLNPGRPDVAATIGVNLGADGSGGTDNKITLSQLGSLTIDPSFSVCSNIGLGLATGESKKFPQFKADLKVTGGISCQAGGVTGAPAANSFGITFDNVRVNAGSVLGDFITPAAQTLRKYTSPLEPVIDSIRKPIPGVAEAARIAGQPAPTWWDLMNLINDVKMGAGEPDQLAMVKKVIYITDLTRSLSGATGGGDIPLGSFNLNMSEAQKPEAAGNADKLLGSVTETDGAKPIIDRLAAAGVPVQVADKLKPVASYSSLKFPVLERPQRLFELLLGKDVPLVRFEAGGTFLHVPIGPFTFPVGPATLYLGGGLDFSGHFAAGFDTYGVRQAYSMLTDDNPANDSFGRVAAGVLGGFYLDDNDAAGNDVPELTARAEITAGAGVGIPGLGVFAEGGVKGRADVDLKSTDGKVRPQQVIDQLRKNPNPVCLFKASAKVSAFIRVVIENPISDVEFPIVDGVFLDEPDLTDFCNTQQDPEAAKLTGKRYADGTLEVFSSADSEQITVTQREVAGTVEVTSSSKGVTEEFTDISRVFVDGAGGNDQITMTSWDNLPKDIAAHVCGGAGQDAINRRPRPGQGLG